jgi:hypothetical protein
MVTGSDSLQCRRRELSRTWLIDALYQGWIAIRGMPMWHKSGHHWHDIGMPPGPVMSAIGGLMAQV